MLGSLYHTLSFLDAGVLTNAREHVDARPLVVRLDHHFQIRRGHTRALLVLFYSAYHPSHFGLHTLLWEHNGGEHFGLWAYFYPDP